MWKCCRSLNRNFQEFTIESGEKDETLKAPITIGEGRYEIKDIKSADGGFGIVYKAIDKRLNNRKNSISFFDVIKFYFHSFTHFSIL